MSNGRESKTTGNEAGWVLHFGSLDNLSPEMLAKVSSNYVSSRIPLDGDDGVWLEMKSSGRGIL